MKWLGLLLGVLVFTHALGQGLQFTYDGTALAGPATYAGTGYAEFSLENGADEGYDLSLMRLSEGKSQADYEAAMAAMAAAFAGQGDVASAHSAIQETVTIIGGVAVAAGEAATVGVLLEPGDYLLDGSCETCAPGQSIRALTVTGGERAEAPTPDRVVEFADFHFNGIPAELPAGSELWEIANVGAENHLFVIFKLAEDKTLADLEAFFESPEFQGGPPPAAYGSEALSSAYLTGPVRYYQMVSLEPGNYVVLCPVLHGPSGDMHTTLGMIQTLTVN